jgi:long-chain fatty acid transport protein
VAALPTIAMVHHLEDSRLSVGLGIYGVSGATVNYPGDPDNPVLTPRNPPVTFGFGPQMASMVVLKMAPVASLELTDRLTIGAGPMIDVATMSLDPAFFAAPDDANNDGVFNFPAGTHGRTFWGGGFQVGAFYRVNSAWNVGLAYKSPHWFERFEYNATDELKNPQRIGLDLTLPSVISLGFAYRGCERAVIALDLRYLDWGETKTFGDSPAAGGLGWESIFAVALGAQYQLTDRLSLRGGYLFNENPVPATATLFNVQVPGINQHQLSLGVGMRLSRAVTFDFAWVHAYQNSITGPIGQLPEADVRLEQSVDSWIVGLGVNY